LDRTLLEKRIFPGIHILKSGTRRDDLLYHPAEFEKITTLRKYLAQLPAIEAMEVLLQRIRATKTNAELLLTTLR
jgi:transcription termination factor Rho